MDKEILLFLCLIWSPNFRKIVKIEHLPLRAAILVSNVPRRRAPFVVLLIKRIFVVFFFDLLVAVASSDLTVPIVSSLSSCEPV